MDTKRNQESGQILIIFAIALTVLLAFTALAVDGGMIYSDRRQSQSVADTASLAGAGAAIQYLEAHGVTYGSFSCANPTVIAALDVAYAAAINRATINNVTGLDNNLDDGHGIRARCSSLEAPFEKYITVKTEVTSTVSTSFAQLFFPNPIKNTVTAETILHPRTEFAFGYAIISTSDQCANKTGGMVYDGTSDVFIDGGGIFSNSCINGNGGPTVHVAAPKTVEYVGTYDGGGHFSPTPQQSPSQMVIPDIGTPNCSGPVSSSTGGGTINPGNYSKIKLTNNNQLTLNPGLYCLSGDVDIQGGTISGDGVTIYLKSTSSMTINGGATVLLGASNDENPAGGALPGILIYMAKGNSSVVKLEGNSGSAFIGAVFAPDGQIEVGGNSGINPTYNTQLIGAFVKVHGTARIDINYNPSESSTTVSKLDRRE